jgi:hypothetical protein
MRVRRLAVTAAGRELVLSAVSVVETTDARLFAAVGDRAQVLAVLRPLAAADPTTREGVQ